jgi:dihydroorotase
MGATNENIEEVLKTNGKKVCGVKVFMGSSTGNMLVDNNATLENIFSKCPLLIATHCEDEMTIRKNMINAEEKYNGNLHPIHHPEIRNEEACYKSSSLAVSLAKKHKTRLHVLHISTSDELGLFDSDIPLNKKKITAEVCVHHLYFTARDYTLLGNQIKCNPAIKESHHSLSLMKALLDNKLDIIATDHAPHTWEEKSKVYKEAPSGLPLVQTSLNIMFDLMWQGKISMEKIVEKMCHAPAECFRINDRGYLDEGYYADITIVDPGKSWVFNKTDILYKCGWSPLEGKRFKGNVCYTIINGQIIYNNGILTAPGKGMRLEFSPLNY